MPDLENYILSGIFFLVLCVAWYIWKLRKKKNILDARQRYVLETLEKASSQFEIFNLRPHLDGKIRNGLSAMLQSIDKAGLHMEASDFIPEDWNSITVDAYFRLRTDDGPIFHVFTSRILKIDPNYEHSHFVLSMPDHLRIEKKRHFIRVQPQTEDIRVIGVWPLAPGQKLPMSTDEMGAPLTHFKPGMTDATVRMENVSASGMALRFKLDKNGQPPMEIKKGSQIVCLVIYVPGSQEKPVAFWCTGEVMNTRVAEGPVPELVLGLEFTNWAVLEQGKGEIHWSHCSPSRGARPILQWVEYIDKRQSEKEQNN